MCDTLGIASAQGFDQAPQVREPARGETPWAMSVVRSVGDVDPDERHRPAPPVSSGDAGRCDQRLQLVMKPPPGRLLQVV
jgi:hypothetical protein